MKTILIVLTILFTSCSGVKKISNSKTSNIESQKGIDTTKSQSSESKTEVILGSSENSEVKKNLQVDFGNGTADDYIDTTLGKTMVTTNKPKNIKLNLDGSLEISGDIKKIKYTETGKKQKADTLHASEVVISKNQQSGIDTSKNKTVITESNKSKVRIGASTGIWIAGILILAVLGFLEWKFGWIGIFKRKDKKQSIPFTGYDVPNKNEKS